MYDSNPSDCSSPNDASGKAFSAPSSVENMVCFVTFCQSLVRLFSESSQMYVIMLLFNTADTGTQ